MADAVQAFFEELRTGDRSSVLGATTTGNLRLDLRAGRTVDRWLVTIDRGEVSVSHGNGPAESVIRMERSLFEGMVEGRVNAMAATLRGLVVAEGHTSIFVKFQRLFPGPPPPGRSRRRATASGR